MNLPLPHSGMPAAATDHEAARTLALHKARATALVAVCALIYIAAKALEARQPLCAYAAAFAEAAIVGALADWYAVVALFRHPLGLPFPHTAIIPANQKRIAQAFGNFITRHFLTAAHVREKIAEFDPAARFGRSLAAPNIRRQLSEQLAHLILDSIGTIDPAELGRELERKLLDGLAAMEVGKLIGGALEVIASTGRHHALLDEVLARLESWLADPSALAAIRERVRHELPTLVRLFRADAYLLERFIRVTLAALADIRRDAAHPIRAEFDQFIADSVERLRAMPLAQHRPDVLARELLGRPEFRQILNDGWERFVLSLRADLDREEGVLRSAFVTLLGNLAQKLQHDQELRSKVNNWFIVRGAALTERHKDEVATFFTAQMQSWDTRRAIAIIERSIGKDLQYIRINGTLVGGLMGLTIFTVTNMFMR